MSHILVAEEQSLVTSYTCEQVSDRLDRANGNFTVVFVTWRSSEGFDSE